MQVQFEINGIRRVGNVVSRGFGWVDAPESYEVEVNAYGFTKWIPISECTVI